uniref:putative ATP-dependent RNA helicase TDRD12 n=1 Tax=Monopterus albus TaxID=43700 RepID=UPI0009B3C804|nr:putative ATP-dependent RNA helicase TDRD12 [Monopterus albus]
MLKLSVLKVENPSCFWGRVIWASGGNTQTTEQYDNLHTQMNLFYHNISWNLRKLNPRPIEEGKVYVVYWPVMKSWCRAMVESVIMDSESCRARCLLVDHGEWLVAPSDQIRDAAQNFLQLPVWVRKFHLGGIQPTTLRVSFLEKAKLVPSTRWDSSATLYLHNLLKDSTQAEAVLLESEPESTSIELYLTIRDIKICVNDDLVAKGFAYYSSTKSTDGSGLGEVVRFPVVPSSGLHQIVSKTSNKPPSVRVNSLAAPRAGDLLTAPSPPQSQEHEQMISKAYGRSEVTEQPPGSQSKNSLGAAAERASSEDPDLSPSAALTTDLSLFRSLKSLNSSTVYQQEAHSELNDCHPTEMTSVCITCTKQDELTSETVIPEEDVLLCMSGKSGAASFVESRQVHLPDAGDETSSSESGPTEKTWRCIEDWACARLLEWLNPGRLNPNPHAADDVVVPSDPRRRGILLHTAFPVDPCTNLDDAPITDDLRRVLQRKQYSTLSLADRYSWPAVARGSNTLIVSHSADQPLSYLAPLVTHILYNSIFCSNTYNTGPIAVLLCPGWEKAQMLYDLLEEIKVTHVLHPVIVLLGVGKDEAKSVKIPKNCLLLVTTPFSLVLLLSCRCFMFMRLYHVVLDEADQLLTHAADQMVTILQHFQKVTFSEINASCPKQLIAVAKRWAGGMEGLVGTYMPSPFILITIPEELRSRMWLFSLLVVAPLRGECANLEHAKPFLESKGLSYPKLGDLDWLEKFYFMVDMTSHLNTLNKNLHGKGSVALQLLEDVLEFERKMTVFARDVQREISQPDLEIELAKIADKDLWVSKFKSLTADLKEVAHQKANLAKQHKWNDIENLPKPDKLVFETWSAIPDTYMNMKKYACGVLSIFGSTYLCEQVFSSMNFIKTKYCSCLTNESLQSCVKTKLTPTQVSLLTLESSKISVMLGALEFNPDISQKTLIVASSAQEVEDVFKVMKSKSTFCLRTHEGLTHQFDNVIQQWRKDIGPRSHVVLVTTTGCLECLGITDASCVIHYSFPTSRKLFGNRLLCMADNFRNLADRDQTESHRSLARSVLLISERNISHIVGVVRYMGRTNTLLPPVLLSFTQGILVTREYEKTNRPLCSYLKSFGVCRDSSMCPDRHRLISQLDQSELPASGVIQVVPLYVKTASLLYGHIIGKDDGGFHIMTSEMASYYADRKPGAKEMLVGGLYAVEEDDVFHRVKILPVPDRHDGLFFRVQFIDVGKEQVLKSCQILELPEQFHSLPSQAVEMIICHVKPVNAEKNWHPKVTRTIGQKIRGLVHQATAVLSLGNTVFVDPMVRVRQVPGLKTVINEYNIQSEILKTGMAVPNPDHVALLRALWQEEPSSGTEAVHIFG